MIVPSDHLSVDQSVPLFTQQDFRMRLTSEFIEYSVINVIKSDDSNLLSLVQKTEMLAQCQEDRGNTKNL